jgi:hypothetical protein
VSGRSLAAVHEARRRSYGIPFRSSAAAFLNTGHGTSDPLGADAILLHVGPPTSGTHTSTPYTTTKETQ